MAVEGCHHDILRRTDTGIGQCHRGPVQGVRRDIQLRRCLRYLCAHGLHRGQVQIDRPAAQRTAAGGIDRRLAAAGKQRTQKQDARAHALHEPLRDIAPAQRVAVDYDRITMPVDPAAQISQNFQRIGHILQPGAMVQHILPLPGCRRCQNGQHRVLRAVYPHLAAQRCAAFYDNALQIIASAQMSFPILCAGPGHRARASSKMI